MSKGNSTEKSIFTIERRKDFNECLGGFIEDIHNSVVSAGIGSGNTMKVSEYLNHCIRYWPYRCGATSVDDYLKGIGIDMSNPEPTKDSLLMMELFINLLYWAPKQNINDLGLDSFSMLGMGKNDVSYESERLLRNAEYILEQCCNMKIRETYVEEDDFPQYHICKRDQNVDAAIEAVPELSDILLGYLDIRNADNRKYKEKALTDIYGFMEPRRKDYKSMSCGAVSEEYFACMNAFGIRHNTKSQVRIHYSKRNNVYDKLFKMAIYVLQTPDVTALKEDMKALRSK